MSFQLSTINCAPNKESEGIYYHCCVHYGSSVKLYLPESELCFYLYINSIGQESKWVFRSKAAVNGKELW